MAYNNVQATANRILGLKNDWNTATAAGDNEKAKQIAANAQNYYKQLRDNGYEGMAQKLTDSDYDQSKKYINDYFAAQGRSAIRPYLKTIGKNYGLSESDIDNAISFNEVTGEVSLGGKNLGKPEAISSDGVSYWNNDTLDKAFSDYVTRAGLSRGLKNAALQETDNLFDMTRKWDSINEQDYKDYMDMVKQNPFTSDEGKAILGQYNLKGYTGRSNALANGAASNGGNIDSYSAANAMRQQAALTAQGQQAALDFYNSKIQNAYNSTAKLENARQLLAQMGVHINDAVANNETILNGEVDRSEKVKDGEVARSATIAQVTGKVPQSMSYSTNQFFNSDGTLRNDNLDYSAIIENAKAQLANSTTEEEKANWNKTIKDATQAGAYKITNNPLYAPYYDAWSQKYPMSYESDQTEEGRQHDTALANSLELAQMGYEHEDNMLAAQNQQEKDMADINTTNSIKLQNNETNNTIKQEQAASANTINEYTSKTNDDIRGYTETRGNLGKTSDSNNAEAPLTTSQVNGWVKFFNGKSQEWHDGEDAITSENGEYVIKNDEDYIAYIIHHDASLSNEQREYLWKKFNVSDAAIDKAAAGK